MNDCAKFISRLDPMKNAHIFWILFYIFSSSFHYSYHKSINNNLSLAPSGRHRHPPILVHLRHTRIILSIAILLAWRTVRSIVICIVLIHVLIVVVVTRITVAVLLPDDFRCTRLQPPCHWRQMHKICTHLIEIAFGATMQLTHQTHTDLIYRIVLEQCVELFVHDFVENVVDFALADVVVHRAIVEDVVFDVDGSLEARTVVEVRFNVEFDFVCLTHLLSIAAAHMFHSQFQSRPAGKNFVNGCFKAGQCFGIHAGTIHRYRQ